jgi:SAM-dependent methyltransferase
MRSTPAVDFDQVKATQKDTWGTGDFGVVARHTVWVGEVLCETVNLRAGERVLDVATGSGNAALSAARRGAVAVGVDYVPALLEQGRRRAVAEQVDVQFHEGDCERLEFPDASFDVVLSVFGVMFAPDQQRAADELVRVCRPGGRIGLACWTPSGFWGQMFKLQSSYLLPPAGVPSPIKWGTEEHLHALFGGRVEFDVCERKLTDFRHGSADDWVDFFKTHFGPIIKAFQRLKEAQRDAFAEEMRALANAHNRDAGGTLVVPGEYLEVVMTKL